MSAVDFSELFQSEATNGTNIRIISANNTTQQLPLETVQVSKALQKSLELSVKRKRCHEEIEVKQYW